MKKTLNILVTIIVIAGLLFQNIAYAQENIAQNEYLSIIGPKIENLKGKNDLIRYYNDLKRIRGNLGSISMNSNSTEEELNQINATLEFYKQEITNIDRELESHKEYYKDSLDDVYTAEMFQVITDNYLLSIMSQQILIREMNKNTIDSRNLFYSEYLIPVYYYLTSADQMIAYIDLYFQIS